MTLGQRISKAYKTLIGSTLGRSFGTVMRNYGQQAKFDPQRQLRGITYKAIDKIGQSVSVYEPIVTRKSGDALEQHPIYNLIDNPNPRQDATDFQHLFAMSEEIFGEVFIYKVFGENSGKLKELWQLNPQQVQLWFDNNELAGYVLHKYNGQQIPFTLDEIYHDKRPNPLNEWRGLSVLERASTYVETEIVSSDFTMNYIKNSASPSGIVSLPDMETTTFNEFVAKWREGYEGPENAGKTAFIRGGEAQFKPVGSTLKDIDQEVTRKMAEDDVLLMFEVPKPLLGKSGEKGMGRADIDALYYIYNKEKIEPIMKRLDRIYESFIPLLSGRDTAPLNISHRSPIPEDKVFNLEQQSKGVNVWLTINEVRAQNGLEPIEGGEVLQPKNQMTPVIETKASKKTTKVVIKKKKAKPTKAQIIKQDQEDGEQFRLELIRVSELYAKKLKRELSKLAKAQETKVIDKISASDKAYEEWLFEIKEEALIMATAITPLLLEQMEVQAEDVVNWISGEPFVIDNELRKVTESRILRLSADYQLANYNKLESIITKAVADGQSLAKIKKAIEGEYKNISGYKAERIARTESLKTANRTALEVYKQSGFSKMVWRTNPGACEFCLTFEGKEIEIGDTFAGLGDVITGSDGNQLKVDYENVDTPDLHPNCTCYAEPVV